MKDMKKYLAEFIGTCVLVFVACGVAGQICTEENGAAGLVGTALAFGLVIVAMAYSIGNISGCHINPAVSLAMLISKKMSAKDFCGYVAAQFLGAVAGAGALYAVTGNAEKLGANNIMFPDACGALYENAFGSFVIELVLTFIFVLAILGVTSKESNGAVAGLVIGGALTLVHLLGIRFTGTSVNPARSFGPALFVGTMGSYWVFLLAPLAGGALAALVYKFLAKEDK